MRAIFKIDTSFVKAFNAVVLDVDHIDIRAIELLEVSVLQARPLDTPVVWHLLWNKNVSLPFIFDPDFLLLDPEVVDGLISFLAEQVVLVVTKPITEATILPQLLEEGLTFLWRIVESVSLGKGIQEASEAVLPD
jgi:hypothetical protein